MGSILHARNGRYLALAPRSGSHSLVAAHLLQHEPQNYAAWQSGGLHPARYLSDQVNDHEIPRGAELGVVVRNPIERFRSMVARHSLSVDEQLTLPMYGPLPVLDYARAFRFESQLQECAEWLGIDAPIPTLAESHSDSKPQLTIEQESRVRAIYADDIALWESLA